MNAPHASKYKMSMITEERSGREKRKEKGDTACLLLILPPRRNLKKTSIDLSAKFGHEWWALDFLVLVVPRVAWEYVTM
jgi:hypothetical protein